MYLVGLDIGTTHCKAALFNKKGEILKLAKETTITHRNENGYAYYQAEELWNRVLKILKTVIDYAEGKEIFSIGIASMAEAGLFIDRSTGRAKSNILPWFDQRVMEIYKDLKKEINEKEMFQKTGLHFSYKYGLNKIIWLKNNEKDIDKNSVWLSVADYIGYRLTGKLATDYTLAARTYLFRIDKKSWLKDWMSNFSLNESNFPDVYPGGTIIGKSKEIDGLHEGIPVSISGHDHVCAALAIGMIDESFVFDSMGTAETLMGTIDEKELGEIEYKSGLTYGCHLVSGKYFWMGGLSSSGGSIEWLRNIISGKNLSYQELIDLVKKTKKSASGILYYPYLSGSGAPRPDSEVKGAFIGLSASHGKSDLIKAVLEGTAYEMESIRRAAIKVRNKDIDTVLAVGGGTKNLEWMQIKADVSSTVFNISSISEATLLGAAILPAINNGLYSDARDAIEKINIPIKKTVNPSHKRHQEYRKIYEEKYLIMQIPLRKVSKN